MLLYMLLYIIVISFEVDIDLLKNDDIKFAVNISIIPYKINLNYFEKLSVI